MTIRNVSRKDARTYVCTGFIRNQELAEYTRRCGIHVDFLPGRAICKEDPNGESQDDLVILHCLAPDGNQRGDFQCYQNGEIVPQHTELISDNAVMKKSLWVNKTSPAFCCSTVYGEQKTCSECDDYVSYSQLGKNSTLSHNACQITSTVTPMQSVQSTESVSTSVTEIRQNNSGHINIVEESKPKNNVSTTIIAIASVGGVVIIFIVVLVGMSYRWLKNTVFKVLREIQTTSNDRRMIP